MVTKGEDAICIHVLESILGPKTHTKQKKVNMVSKKWVESCQHDVQMLSNNGYNPVNSKHFCYLITGRILLTESTHVI